MAKWVQVGVLMGATLGVSVHAQVYRCGAMYSETPCAPGAIELAAPKGGHSIKEVPGRTLQMIESCKAVLRVQLKDPDSAKFEDAFRGDTTPLFKADGQTLSVRNYWLRVNAKNSYGGYEGAHTYRCAVDPAETKVLSVTR